jgi:hypothetical protein
MIALETFIEDLARQGANFVTMETAVAAHRTPYPDGLNLRG